MIDRRTLLIGSAAMGLAPSTRAMGQPERIFTGPQILFSFEKLIDRAKELSTKPYQKPVVHDPELLERLDFDAYQQIKFRPELAIWGQGDGPYPIELFHVGR
jgi:glucans biosynthesis protein